MLGSCQHRWSEPECWFHSKGCPGSLQSNRVHCNIHKIYTRCHSRKKLSPNLDQTIWLSKNRSDTLSIVVSIKPPIVVISIKIKTFLCHRPFCHAIGSWMEGPLIQIVHQIKAKDDCPHPHTSMYDAVLFVSYGSHCSEDQIEVNCLVPYYTHLD